MSDNFTLAIHNSMYIMHMSLYLELNIVYLMSRMVQNRAACTEIVSEDTSK